MSQRGQCCGCTSVDNSPSSVPWVLKWCTRPHCLCVDVSRVQVHLAQTELVGWQAGTRCAVCMHHSHAMHAPQRCQEVRRLCCNVMPLHVMATCVRVVCVCVHAQHVMIVTVCKHRCVFSCLHATVACVCSHVSHVMHADCHIATCVYAQHVHTVAVCCKHRCVFSSTRVPCHVSAVCAYQHVLMYACVRVVMCVCVCACVCSLLVPVCPPLPSLQHTTRTTCSPTNT